MTIGEAMKAAREKAGFSRNELAELAGIRHGTLWGYENDKHIPLISAAEMLADTLGISIDEYVGHEVSEIKKPHVEVLKKIKQHAKVEAIKELEGRLITLIGTVKKEMGVDLNE